MDINPIDWTIIIAFLILSLVIGIVASKSAGRSTKDFFLSGRNLPWWLLGISMVATTFSADTPNLVTNIVRKQGIAGNWQWWAFLLTGMLTVFVYARLWRRSEILTDLEFYELRYSGKEARFLRAFRSLYLGVFFNVMIMATVCLAATKFGAIFFQFPPWKTLLIACSVTVIYSALGGLKGVVITDFFQFIIAITGSIWAAVYVLDMPEIGGLSNLMTHPNVVGKLNFLPDFNDWENLIPLFLIPIAVQWWSVWYPGSEPGGGGYVAQRMLAAKNEKHAVGATLLFNLAHYALRPWPWIIIALASMIVFPSLDSLQIAFNLENSATLKDDMAYPAMLTLLPVGLLGLVIASLMSAFMSTISSHLNWGSSYIVHDFYNRFINPSASEQKLVSLGRWSTVLLMLAGGLLSQLSDSALEWFQVLLQIGAGTGLIFILRWFWKRINAYSEIAGMVISFIVAMSFLVLKKMGYDVPEGHWQMLIGVIITTIGWLTVTYITPPTDEATLKNFFEKIRIDDETGSSMKRNLLSMFLGCVAVYSSLFATGSFLKGNGTLGWVLCASFLICSFLLYRNAFKKIRIN